MVFKIAGIIMVLAGAGGLGAYYTQQLKKRLDTLYEIKKMILMLKSEIAFSHAPLAEAFERIGNKSNSAAGKFFSEIAVKLSEQPGEPFYEIWKRHIKETHWDSCFLEKDKQELTMFGEHLGYLDLQMQERTISLYLEQLDLTINYLREHQEEKSRLYLSMGVMGGLFLAIIIF